MAQQDAFALSRSNLNAFLFADIGVEGSGMPLSVISALAREGLDPWQEAGRLATLPRSAATDGLARLIAAMPASLWPLPDATEIAARLVALLPRQVERPVATRLVLSSLLEDQARPGGSWLIAVVLALALLTVVAAYLAPAPAGTGPAGPDARPASAAPTSQVPVGD